MRALKHLAALVPMLVALVAPPGPAALATPADYCAAYARDFADRVLHSDPSWEQRRKSALADCLLQYGPAQAPRQAAEQPAKAKSNTATAPEDIAAQDAPEPQVTPVMKAKKQIPATALRKTKSKPKPLPVPTEDSASEPLPEPAVIVAPDIAPPAKPEKKATPPAKAKTLFARIFKPKVEATPDGKPAPFSNAWLDYCERKYASFNRATGTYTSFKGVERKCLVTD